MTAGPGPGPVSGMVVVVVDVVVGPLMVVVVVVVPPPPPPDDGGVQDARARPPSSKLESARRLVHVAERLTTTSPQFSVDRQARSSMVKPKVKGVVPTKPVPAPRAAVAEGRDSGPRNTVADWLVMPFNGSDAETEPM